MTKKTTKVQSTNNSDMYSFTKFVLSIVLVAVLVMVTIQFGKRLFAEKVEKVDVSIYNVGVNVVCQNKLGVVVGVTDKRNIVSYGTGKDYIGTECEEIKELDCNMDGYTGCMINL